MARFVLDSIQLPSSGVAGEKPPATLKHGELWVNTADKIIYAGLDGLPPVAIDGAPSGTSASVLAAIKRLQDDAVAAKADVAQVRVAIKPILDHGFRSAGGIPAAGGIPTLDRVGQIPPSMIGGTDAAPARAGEVPKFKGNGKLSTGLIDYNFASVTAPSTGGHTPTVADSGKLVRLDAQGKLDTSLLGLDPLDYKGELSIGPAGTPLTGESLNGAGHGGTIWIVASAAAKSYDVNFSTGAVVEHTGPAAAGTLEVKTGDLLVKSNDKKMHRINADLIPTAHLLPRDGSRAMIGNLVFQKTGTSSTHDISGAHSVSADEAHFHKIVAEMLPGTPGVANGTIEDFLIDGDKNVIRFRHGTDPRIGRVDGKLGEVFVDATGLGTRIFFCTADGPNWLEGVAPFLIQEVDLLSEAKSPTDSIATAFGHYKASWSPAEVALQEDMFFLGNYEEDDVRFSALCLKRGGSANDADWSKLGILSIPKAALGKLGLCCPDGVTIKADASGVLSVDASITQAVKQLQSDFAALKADYDAYRAAHP